MIDSLKRKRIFIAIAGLIIVIVSFYGYRITEKRQTVFEKGQIVSAVVKKLSYGKNTENIYVVIKNKEYDAGDAIGQYSNCKKGDTIEVYWIADIEYVVLKDKNSITNFFILEITSFILGLLLIIFSPFLNDKNKINIENLVWPKGKKIDANNLDRYFSILMRKPNFMLKIDINSLTLLNQKIIEIFNESPNETIDYLEVLLKRQDFKLDYIYFGLMDSDLFKNKFFDIEFNKVFTDYLKNPSSYHEQIFQTFMLSSHFDTDDKIRTEIINLIESSYSKLDNKSVNRLKKIKKTCT
jgi:hypothetical protein